MDARGHFFARFRSFAHQRCEDYSMMNMGFYSNLYNWTDASWTRVACRRYEELFSWNSISFDFTSGPLSGMQWHWFQNAFDQPLLENIPPLVHAPQFFWQYVQQKRKCRSVGASIFRWKRTAISSGVVTDGYWVSFGYISVSRFPARVGGEKGV